MRLNQNRHLFCLVLTLATLGITDSARAEAALSVGISQNYSEGDYGTSNNTAIEYIPFFVKYQEGDLTLKVTVPYISVQSAGAAISGGMVVGSPGSMNHNPGAITTESGLGDVWIEGRYRLHGQGSAPDIIPYAKVKVGTASRSNGLGTGENDYEGGVGLEWMAGSSLFPFVDGGYRIMGSPPGTSLRNIFTYDGGAMVKVNEKDYVTGMLAGYQSAVSGESDALDLVVALKHPLSPTTHVQVYFDKGLTRGSPSYAAGVGLETRL